MVAQSSKITQADYNNFYSSIYNVLGAGSGTTGYGQTLNFSPTSVTTSTKIKLSHWASIRADILRMAKHQGLAQNSGWSAGNITSIPVLPSIDVNTKLRASTITSFQNALSVVTNAANIYKVAAGEYSDEALTSSSRSTGWNQGINHFFYVDFGSAANARYFFNAGGTIRVTPSYAKDSSTSINNDWETLVGGVGTLSFGYTNTAIGGSQVSSIGFYDLTNSAQQIYSRSGGGINSTYSANDYRVRVYSDVSNNSSGGARYVYFECYFEDLKYTVDPTWGTDEYVTGTVTSAIRMYRPSESSLGTGVVVSAPSATNTTVLTSGS